MKWIGLICILLSCSGLGLSFAADYKERIRNLTEILDIIQSLGEYVDNFVPLGEGLERVKMRSGEKYKPFLSEVCLRIEKNDGESLGQIWKENAVMLKRNIDKRDYRLFEECMHQTGFLDEKSQKRALESYGQSLKDTIQKLKEEQKDQCKLYRTIGVLAGLFLCVLFI